jgi:hypothetical protein
MTKGSSINDVTNFVTIVLEQAYQTGGLNRNSQLESIHIFLSSFIFNLSLRVHKWKIQAEYCGPLEPK